MEDVGHRLRWVQESIVAHKGPPLLPLGEVLMEVEDGTVPAQEDSATVEEENSTTAKQAAYLA